MASIEPAGCPALLAFTLAELCIQCIGARIQAHGNVATLSHVAIEAQQVNGFFLQ